MSLTAVGQNGYGLLAEEAQHDHNTRYWEVLDAWLWELRRH